MYTPRAGANHSHRGSAVPRGGVRGIRGRYDGTTAPLRLVPFGRWFLLGLTLPNAAYIEPVRWAIFVFPSPYDTPSLYAFVR